MARRVTPSTFQSSPIPFRKVSSRFIRALKEFERHSLWIRRLTYEIVRQNPLVHIRVVVRAFGANRRYVAARRLRIRVRVERGLCHRRANRPRPPARTDAFVRVRLARHAIGQIRNPTRMLRSAPARESRARNVESSPPQMRRTRFPEEASSKFLERAIGANERLPAPMNSISVVRCVLAIISEAQRIGQLPRHWPHPDIDAERMER